MDCQRKVLSLEQAAHWRQQQRESGCSVVLTNGCFDLLHPGHVRYLHDARQQGDVLCVAMNSDASVRAVKGPTRPVIPEHDRAFMLAALEAVDAVIIFDTPNAIPVFKQIPPDVYVKGGDYTEETLNRDEYPVLKATGCRFCFIPVVAGYSTTSLIAQLARE